MNFFYISFIFRGLKGIVRRGICSARRHSKLLKKIFGTAIIIALLTVVVVQAMEKEKEEAVIIPPTTESIPVHKVPGPEIGQKAPDFKLETLDGKTVQLSDLQGKRVMLNFWATWCPPCKAEMPAMEKLYQEAGDDFEIIAVNIDTKNDVAGFVNDMGLTFPILLDKTEQVMKTYQILSIPTSYFIDRSGVIQHKFIGAMPFDKMKELTDSL